MAYTFSKTGATEYTFITTNGNQTKLNSSAPNGVGTLHASIIALVTTDESKKDRFGLLLELDPGFGYAKFCFENNLVILPDETIPESNE